MRDSLNKQNRQKVMIQIIQEGQVGTQEELALEMKKRGMPCTQTTISRDLNDLRVSKAGGFYFLPKGGERLGLERILWESGKSVDSAGDHLVVLRTEVGGAASVAVELDKTHWPEMVGTLAGDDTIFIAVAKKQFQKNLVQKIKKFLKTKGET